MEEWKNGRMEEGRGCEAVAVGSRVEAVP